VTTQPTDKKNRLDECTRLIEEAMKCLENGDKECVMRALEELIKAECHNGNAVGKEAADEVRELVHGLWLASNREEICELLRMLRDLGILRNWVRDALSMGTKRLNEWLVRCNIDWEGRTARNDVVKDIENLLRERFGWSETRMCEEMWRFIGVDVDEFRKYGMEPCVWLEGINELSNLRNPYWFGLKASDLAIEKLNSETRLELKTTNSIDAVFFATLLNTVKTPSLEIKWKRGAPAAKYVSKSIALSYYVDLGIDEWSWPIRLNTNELERIIKGFTDEELAMFIAGEIDGDGTIWCIFKDDNVYIYVEIAACKDCPKRANLDILKKVIAERFGIISRIKSRRTTNDLEFGGENAVKLLRLIRPFVHHPLRRLRIELILALYDGRISREAFEKLYEMTEYEYGGPDVKRNRSLEALARAAPQTHTHGGINAEEVSK